MSVNRSVHSLIEEQAKLNPHAIAVVEGQSRITYRELDARAGRLALRLHESGVQADVPVAIYLPRSIDFVVAALGLLKSGGAYLPIDPRYPANRVAMLLEDSAAPLVITRDCLDEKLPPAAKGKVVLISETTPNSREGFSAECGPENLAYIIFTSGSTGRPKGVQVTHANLLNLIGWHREAFDVSAADRATLHASSGFDASVWELWPYLAAGAAVHVVEEEVRAAPEQLRDWLQENQITISFLPTALAEAMLELPWPQQCSPRVMLTGADKLRSRPPAGLPFALINNYGPTECTVVATSGAVQAANEAQKPPSIGKPIDNVAVYIVDELMQQLPLGETGEILIGGAGVARGYINAPELTAVNFIADHFSGAPGARLYRTGDLGRYLPNGEIEFLGRVDEQIKVMGYRVEPSEISNVLDRHPSVKQSIVAGRSDAAGICRLIAYIVPANSDLPKPCELRTLLSEHLPDYMVPSIFVQLPEVPVTAHGKVNREALPEPDAHNTLSDEIYDSPQTPIEQHLASFLAGLVGVERVGLEDNFFNLGGHSLMGAQLIAKIRESFGVELPLRSLFEAPTIRGMAAEIERLIYEKISTMSDDEARSLLASSMN